MRVLNLYAGIGGNRKLWGGGINITSVELDENIAEIYRGFYPSDTLIIADAHEYLLQHHHEFDFVWSSPPCQTHTKMIRSGRNRKRVFPDCKLYEEILMLKHDFKGKWVVENVVPYYEPMMSPIRIDRHLFWSNYSISSQVSIPDFKNFINRQNLTAKKQLMDWLGMHYDKNVYYKDNHCPTQILRNCVHPLLGKHVFECASIQTTLFK